MESFDDAPGRNGYSLEDVLITGELNRRASRRPDYEVEARALGELASELANNPRGLLQKVVDSVMTLCRADSAGVSILEPGGDSLRWHATSGAFAATLDGTIPRQASPCGDVILRNQVVLVDRPARYFPALRAIDPPIHEALIAPWEASGESTGTLWAISHIPDRHFDREDARLIVSLARLAAAAWQAVVALDRAHMRREAVEREIEARTRELTAANEQLRAAAERLRTALSIETVGVVFFTLDGRITDANAAFERMSGYTRDELRSLVDWEVLTAPEFQEVTAHAAEELTARGETSPYEKELRRKDGSRWWGLCAPKCLTQNGEGTECIEFVLDITDRKHAEEELEKRVRQRTSELARTNAALQAELRERRAAEERITALLKRLITIQEEERARIARDIHDQIGQQMTALRISLEAVRTAAGERTRAAALGRSESLAEELDRSVDFLTLQLRPASLDHLGLSAALASLVRAWSQRSGIPVEYRSSGPDQPRLPPDVEANLYRVAQEALHNVSRHAGATSVAVSMEQRDGCAVLVIRDDGRGFSPPDAGLGLVSMRERAKLAGGELEVQSAPANGTTIRVRVPLEPGG